MKWLNLFRRNSDLETEPIRTALALARKAVDDGKMEDCIQVLADAKIKCKTVSEREELFGVNSAPAQPTGIAGLAYRHLASHRDVATAWTLLDYCEMEQGTGLGLCEAWFALALIALDRKQFDLTCEAFSRSLRSQTDKCTGPHGWAPRITPCDLAQHCIRNAERWVNGEEFGPALDSLCLISKFATTDETRCAVANAMSLVQVCQQSRRSRVRHSSQTLREKQQYDDYVQVKHQVGDALYELWKIEEL